MRKLSHGHIQGFEKLLYFRSVPDQHLKTFDDTIQDLQMIDDHNYRLTYQDKSEVISDKELIYLLSSSTTKGLLLYVIVVASLQNGFDLLIDEVENHFHKTLVENMISLYKDKSVNKKNSSP